MRVLNPKFDNINASTLHFLSHLHSYLVALSLRYACFFDHPEKFFRSPRVVLGVCLRGGFVRILCTRINVFPPCDLETRNLCAHPRRREPFARCRRRYSGWMDLQLRVLYTLRRLGCTHVSELQPASQCDVYTAMTSRFLPSPILETSCSRCKFVTYNIDIDVEIGSKSNLSLK